jgi:hypothetical protein
MLKFRAKLMPVSRGGQYNEPLPTDVRLEQIHASLSD